MDDCDYIYSPHGWTYAVANSDPGVRFIHMSDLAWPTYPLGLTDILRNSVGNAFRLPEHLLRPQEDSDGMGTTEEGG